MHSRDSFFPSFLKSKVFFIFLFVIFMMLLLNMFGHIRSLLSYKKEIEIAKSTIETLEEQNIVLNDILAFLTSEKATEELARAKLGWKKAGETALIISNDSNSEQQTEQQTQKLSNLQKWIAYFLE